MNLANQILESIIGSKIDSKLEEIQLGSAVLTDSSRSLPLL